MIRPNILILGRSGGGKSTSIRNLDPSRTFVINTERKKLPFRHEAKFLQKNVYTYEQFISLLTKSIDSDKIDNIVIDSFTFFWELAMQKAKAEKQSSSNHFAVWDYFAELTNYALSLTRGTEKMIAWIAHEERLPIHQNDEDYETDALIDGKKIKKVPIAARFEIVLHAKKETTKDGGIRFVFYNNGLQNSPAKSPFEMFSDCVIPNDLKIVEDAINAYYAPIVDEVPAHD